MVLLYIVHVNTCLHVYYIHYRSVHTTFSVIHCILNAPYTVGQHSYLKFSIPLSFDVCLVKYVAIAYLFQSS